MRAEAVLICSALTLGVVESKMNLTDKCTPTSCIPLGLNTLHYKARGAFEATTLTDPPYCGKCPARVCYSIEYKLLDSN